MTMRWLLAGLHLLALGFGLGSVLHRGWSLRGPLDDAGLKRALRSDAIWGLSLATWIFTGAIRLFGSYEKGASYYLYNSIFWGKMGLLAVILLLEIPPMLALIQWRADLRGGKAVDTSRAGAFAGISMVEAGLVAAMVFMAAGMARGLGS